MDDLGKKKTLFSEKKHPYQKNVGLSGGFSQWKSSALESVRSDFKERRTCQPLIDTKKKTA